MARFYDSSLLEKLNKNAFVVRKGNVEEIIKPSPLEPRNGFADPLFKKNILEKPRIWTDPVMREKMKTMTPEEIVDLGRKSMDEFVENINSVAVFSKMEVFQNGDHSYDLWRYYTKRSMNQKNRPALLFMHGGAWKEGSAYACESYCRYIAELTDAVVFNVDYALCPEYKYPAGLTDCYLALCHIAENSEAYGIDKSKICVAGDSAGGNFAAALSIMARDKGFPHIALQILLFPAIFQGNILPADYRWDRNMMEIADEEMEWFRPFSGIGEPLPLEKDDILSGYIEPGTDLRNPYIQPGWAEDLTGVADALIMVGSFDGFRICSEYYAQKLKNAGINVRLVIYQGIGHTFINSLGHMVQAEDSALEIMEAMKKL